MMKPKHNDRERRRPGSRPGEEGDRQARQALYYKYGVTGLRRRVVSAPSHDMAQRVHDLIERFKRTRIRPITGAGRRLSRRRQLHTVKI